MKFKLLFINPSLCQGGLEHSLITMLKLLPRGKYDISLLLCHDDMTLLHLVPPHITVILDKNTTRYNRNPKAVVLHLIKAITKTLGLRKTAKKAEKLLQAYIHKQKIHHAAGTYFKNQCFDAVIANAVGKICEIALSIKAKKHLVFFHSSLDLHHELLTTLFPRFDTIIAVSQGVQDMLRNAYPHVKDKILLLENYVNADEVLEKSRSNDNEAKSYLLEDGLTLCSCGRLSAEKGFDLAVEAAYILKNKNIHFRWVFVGDGAEREKLEFCIKQYDLADQIVITGNQDNPFPYIANCHIYVQPSYEESYGRTIKEALILRRPVVSTDTIGGQTLLSNGKGILTPVSAEGLVEGILKLLDYPSLKEELMAQNAAIDNLKERQLYLDTLQKYLVPVSKAKEKLSLDEILKVEYALYLGKQASRIRDMKRDRHKRYVIWKYLVAFRKCQYWRNIRFSHDSNPWQRRWAKFRFRHYNRLRNMLGSECGVEIGLDSRIGKACDIWHSGVVINGCIGDNCVFHGNNTIGNKGIGRENETPIVGNNVDFGVGSVAIGRIIIADACIIAANAVVTKSVEEPNSILIGIPARKMEKRSNV